MCTTGVMTIRDVGTKMKSRDGLEVEAEGLELQFGGFVPCLDVNQVCYMCYINIYFDEYHSYVPMKNTGIDL